MSRQACASGAGDRVVVDPEAHVPYDMSTETAMAPSPLAGEGAPLSWRPSAVADAGNGPDGPAPTQSRQGWDGGWRQAPH